VLFSTLKKIRIKEPSVLVFERKKKSESEKLPAPGYYLLQKHQRTDSFLSMKELIKSRAVKNAIFGNFKFFEKQSSYAKTCFSGKIK
jgi:hypothetical protein